MKLQRTVDKKLVEGEKMKIELEYTLRQLDVIVNEIKNHAEALADIDEGDGSAILDDLVTAFLMAVYDKTGKDLWQHKYEDFKDGPA